jgi:hypothetical protein
VLPDGKAALDLSIAEDKGDLVVCDLNAQFPAPK